VLCAASLVVGLGVKAATFDSEGRIVLTAEEKTACAKGDGCVVLPMNIALALLGLAEKAGKCGANWKIISF
jgi:hypothetical protein